MKLAIISHTEHYKDAAGNIVGWGPTISEINHLAQDFETIYHVAFYYDESPPPSALPYNHNNIFFVPLKPVGGRGLGNKLKIVLQAPALLKTIARTLQQVDVFQFRAPTGMGVFVIPYLTLFSKKKGWFKYAGNWIQEKPPMGYAMQRWMLKKQKRTVTINGKWQNQPRHCLSFENPCLTQADREAGAMVIQNKTFAPPFRFCFVGRLEDAKGVQRILDAFVNFDQLDLVESIHLIGDGEKRAVYQDLAEQHSLPVVFHRFLGRDQVFEIYKQAHFILLPSASEGFPKVIAEAMNFGCVPIVSDVSSIGQYVNSKNGFILDTCSAQGVADVLHKVATLSEAALQARAHAGYGRVANFTFEHYRQRIQNEILKNQPL